MKTVAYEERFGEIKLPEGFAETLQGLPIDAQMARYRTTRRSEYSMTNWSERTSIGFAKRLDENSAVTALIVKDSLLVGVMMRNDSGLEVPCLAEKCVCTYYASDNNGAGYKERIDYTYLLCVSKHFHEE